MPLTVNAAADAAVVATQEVEVPEACLARTGVNEEGIPNWVLAKAGSKEFVQCGKELCKDLEAQYAIGGRRSNFNVANLEPQHKLWFHNQGIKDGWMNRNAAPDHVGFAFNPTPELDTKGITPDELLAKFVPRPREQRNSASLFAGRASRFARR